MSTNTAKFIIHRAGLDWCSLRELRDLLSDRYAPLQENTRNAIKTLTMPQGGKTWTR
jgi:O-acetyl-ADP-ribose deacetylase (regulator of RNase III)